MAGTFTIKSLGDGQLPNAKGTIYTCPVLTTTIVKTITLVNTNNVTEDVNLYVKRSGSTSRRIIPEDCEMGIGYSLIFDDELCLSSGDIIEGDAVTAAKVDYTINGVEES
jgi:hypothetical protein